MPRNAATQENTNNTENMEQQVPFEVTITEHNPERGVLANADVNVAGIMTIRNVKIKQDDYNPCGIDRPKGLLYHYTKRENIEPILQDGRIRKFKDRECWFCTSLEDALRLMELTVMEEGKLYYDANGLPRRYPKFVPEEYVVLELSPRYQNGDWVIWNQEFPGGAPEEIRKLGEEFSHLKIGFRGDLRFYENPNIYEVAELFQEQTQTPQITM